MDIQLLAALSENALVEFFVPGSGAQYIDLSQTELYVKCHIILGNGEAIPAIPNDPEDPIPDDARVGPVDNILHSLYRQVDVFGGDHLVSTSGLNYPYKSMIDVLLKYDVGAKQSQLESQLYFKDTTYYMGDPDPIAGANQGLKAKQTYSVESKKIDMQGWLNVDVFQA